MRSLYVAILLALTGTLSLSLVAFLAISGQIERDTVYRTFERTDELQLEEARKALDHGGPSRCVGLYAACRPDLWWLALSPQFRGCRCRFRSGSIELDPCGWSDRRAPTPRRQAGNQPQNGGWRVLVYRPPTRSASTLGVLSVLPAGHWSYRNSLLGCGGLGGIADPRSNCDGGAISAAATSLPAGIPAAAMRSVISRGPSMKPLNVCSDCSPASGGCWRTSRMSFDRRSPGSSLP